MKEKKQTAALFQIRVPQEKLKKHQAENDTWIAFRNSKLKTGDVLKIIDESNLSNYLKFEVIYIGEVMVNIKLINK